MPRKKRGRGRPKGSTGAYKSDSEKRVRFVAIIAPETKTFIEGASKACGLNSGRYLDSFFQKSE